MKHALIIGGSGMLRELSLKLTSEYTAVSVVARDRKRLETLARQSLKILPLAVDYSDFSTFWRVVESAIEKNGPLRLVVAWVHEHAHSLPLRLASELGRGNTPAILYQIHGSAYANPAQQGPSDSQYKKFSLIQFRRIVLGFKVEGCRSRWLTHHEISSGVFESIQSNQSYSVVGEVEPWEMRP